MTDAEMVKRAQQEVERRNSTPLDETSVRIAHSLAKAHRHTWGGLDLDAIPQPWTADVISQACREQGLVNGDSMPGITSPEIHGENCISHMTASGRLSWDVRSHSLVLIWSRPAGEYCVVSFDWDEDGVAWMEIQTLEAPPIYARHIEYVLRDVRVAIEALKAGVLNLTKVQDGFKRIVDHLDPYRVDEIANIDRIIAIMQEHRDELMADRLYEFTNPVPA